MGDVLFCHGSPRSDEEIITSATDEGRLQEMMVGVKQDVVVCGHTHMQFECQIDGKRVINAGSVGMPYEGQPGAYWLLLGPEVSFLRTPYDLERAADFYSELLGLPVTYRSDDWVVISQNDTASWHRIPACARPPAAAMARPRPAPASASGRHGR